jgi:ubiquinone/menaquinone biosynthesis C-methylase UbiE
VNRCSVVDEQFATAFANAAEAYHRGRPGYPRKAVDALTRELRLGQESVVVDLAAGTGKLTGDLTDRFDRVLAIEPLAEMRELLARTVPTAEALEGTAERMPLPETSADAIYVAQAFHWFDGRRALDEIARVLRPGGGLGLLWNTTPWERREGVWFSLLDDVLERSRADLSTMRRHASGRWLEAFDGEERFLPLSYAVFDNTQKASPEDVLANLASRSYVARLDPGAQQELLAEVSDLIAQPGAPLDRGHLVVPMQTAAYWTRLRVG